MRRDFALISDNSRRCGYAVSWAAPVPVGTAPNETGFGGNAYFAKPLRRCAIDEDAFGVTCGRWRNYEKFVEPPVTRLSEIAFSGHAATHRPQP